MDFMKTAFDEAEIAYEKREVPIGCVFVYKNKIVGRGRNMTNETGNATRHAEMVAIDKMLEEDSFDPSLFRETDLYVTIEPCIMCASALSQIGIRKVYFGAHNDKFGGCGSILCIHNDRTYGEKHHQYEIESGLMKEEAILLLQKFYNRGNINVPEEKRKRKHYDE
ncbi:hypothetical protein WA158_008325 [Blastocystis sp. Blastoise]